MSSGKHYTVKLRAYIYTKSTLSSGLMLSYGDIININFVGIK